MNDVGKTKAEKDKLDTDTNQELEKIRHFLYDKLNRMLDGLKDHQLNQRADALKLQQELSILKKEKLELYQRVNDLQRKIADMETCIGQDSNSRL